MGRIHVGRVLLLALIIAAPLCAQDMEGMHQHGPAGASADDSKSKGAVATPTFSPPAGSYAAPLTVALATTTAGATIYYTTDGSSPSRKTSPTYKGPLALSRTGKTTVRAFATLMPPTMLSSPQASRPTTSTRSWTSYPSWKTTRSTASSKCFPHW